MDKLGDLCESSIKTAFFEDDCSKMCASSLKVPVLKDE